MSKERERKDERVRTSKTPDTKPQSDEKIVADVTEVEEEKAASATLDQKPAEDKRKFFIEIIKIRLDGIGEATKRARITFIISVIASCSMLITLFNTYYSWTRQRGFDNSFKYKAVKIADEEGFIKNLEDENTKKFLTNHFESRWNYKCKEASGQAAPEKAYKKCIDKENGDWDALVGGYRSNFNEVSKNAAEREKSLADIGIKTLEIEKKLNFQKEKLTSKLEKSRENILRIINESLLNDNKLYEQCGEGVDFYNFFAPKKKEELNDAQKKDKGDDLKNKISEKVFNEDTVNYYDATNHLNKIILQKKFPEIEWKATVQDIGIPISLYEENKRALSREWIENQNVRVNLLGISVNVDQFSFIGSFTLMVITIWMLFSFRRENRSIVSLLRDVKSYVNWPLADKTGKKLQPEPNEPDHDDWKIADLTLHGIAHNLLFAHTGKNDLPMSEKNIFDDPNGRLEKIINNLTELATKLIRAFSYILLLLPVISIGLILWVDDYTTTNMIYPYSNNPMEYLINRNINSFPSQIDNEISMGMTFLLITLLVCLSCFVFQKRTADALRNFEKQLGKESKADDSWWEGVKARFRRE